jgi:hypothetical protein
MFKKTLSGYIIIIPMKIFYKLGYNIKWKCIIRMKQDYN